MRRGSTMFSHLQSKTEQKCLKGCHASKTNICMALCTKDMLAFCIVGNRARMLTLRVKFLTGELWITELCEVRLSELRGGHKHPYKLTLTLCGFLQCSLSTLSTVMLLGRITTSLLLSLHVSSHSSPVCVCVSNREPQKQNQ